MSIVLRLKNWRCYQFFPLLFCSFSVTATSMTDRLTQLQAAIETERQQLNIPAITIIIVNQDEPLFVQAFGTVAIDSNEPVTPQHYFRIGSITKTFTALTTLRLVQNRQLHLTDTLQQLAPEAGVVNPWQATHPIQLQHLLEHTAGLNDLTGKEFDFNEPLTLPKAFSLAPDSRISRWPPGLHHSYSNIYPGLLTAVIENVSQQPFEDVMQQELLQPLHMHSATLQPEQRVLDRLVSGYDSDGKTPIPYWHMTYRAFGALNIKPIDMVPFLQLFLNRGQYKDKTIIQSEFINRMETPTTTLAANSGLTFGYGFSVYPFISHGHVFYGHGGDADGYLSRFGYQKEAGLAYFVGINVFRQNDLTRIRKLVEAFITDQLPQVRYPKTTLPTSTLQQYTGDYASVTWRFPNAPADQVTLNRIRIVNEGGELIWIDSDGERRNLIAVNAQHFRLHNEPVATIAFSRQGDTLYLQSDLGNYQRISRSASAR